MNEMSEMSSESGYQPLQHTPVYTAGPRSSGSTTLPNPVGLFSFNGRFF